MDVKTYPMLQRLKNYIRRLLIKPKVLKIGGFVITPGNNTATVEEIVNPHGYRMAIVRCWGMLQVWETKDLIII